MKARTFAGLLSGLALGTLAAHAQTVPVLPPTQTLMPDQSDFSNQRQTDFGGRLDSDGNTLVVGLSDTSGPGAVAIFTRDADGVWSRSDTVTPIDSEPSDQFGSGVAVDRDILLVTSGVRDVYVFERAGGVWTQLQKLTLRESVTGSLDVANGTAAVGAVDFETESSGDNVTVVLERKGSGLFTRTATLRPSGDVGVFGGRGHSVALNQSGNTLLIGVPEEAESQGAAYIFRSHGARWVEQQKLIAMDGSPGDEFGFSVALDNQFALIGAPQATGDEINGNGTGYVFVRRGNLWQEQYRLQPTAAEWPHVLGALGTAVAITSDSFVISAPFAFPGVLFVYERNRSRPILKAHAFDGLFLGSALASSGTTLFAGVPLEEQGGRVIVYNTADARSL